MVPLPIISGYISFINAGPDPPESNCPSIIFGDGEAMDRCLAASIIYNQEQFDKQLEIEKSTLNIGLFFLGLTLFVFIGSLIRISKSARDISS
ncbi:hypothetical protein DSAG12_02029 [Promethearchaeum syntrophicum]|uniref:Uncharacterized protein n=1 Tax=Promethearchaeum syntrophicum TaxID=2594042 RepID=A0A5B9DAF3_9ARCH|nr:hypothetical protein [Candidatus Prometheoarchaeum syntrophicum]